MAFDATTYARSKKYTDTSIEGTTGVIAGKNCTIESVVKEDGVNTVTFKWTADNGDVRRTTMRVNDGKGIKSVYINEQNHFIVVYEDDTEQDAGAIEIQSAVSGVKGSAEEEYRHGNVNISKANIGLGNVDNTSDINKPISKAVQTALDNKVSCEVQGERVIFS